MEFWQDIDKTQFFQLLKMLILVATQLTLFAVASRQIDIPFLDSPHKLDAIMDCLVYQSAKYCGAPWLDKYEPVSQQKLFVDDKNISIKL